MAHQKPVELVEVEHKHDPVLCPKCGEKALKTACPVKPMPDPPKHGENMSVALEGVGVLAKVMPESSDSRPVASVKVRSAGRGAFRHTFEVFS